MLESRIAARPAATQSQEAAKWLENIRSRVRVNWDLFKDMPKSVYPWDGVEVYPMSADIDSSELSQIRSQAIDYIIELGPPMQ